MSDVEINPNLENNDYKDTNHSNEIFITQENHWEEIKTLISKNIKEIFWKAWIKPLKFEKYEKGILYLSTETQIISSRAENQYYETIFFEASNFFKSLKKIQFHTDSFKNNENISIKNKVKKVKIDQQNNYNDLSFIDSVSMKTNSKFSFNNFVVGEANQMPYAASKRICENSLIYNPLFTHLDFFM